MVIIVHKKNKKKLSNILVIQKLTEHYQSEHALPVVYPPEKFAADLDLTVALAAAVVAAGKLPAVKTESLIVRLVPAAVAASVAVAMAIVG